MSSSSQPETAIVVGSGIIGIACAHYLSKAGLQVTVIDRNSLAGACSHGNCGYICPSHVLPLTEPGAFRTALKSLFTPHAPFRVKPRFSPPLWNWMWQFARRCNHRQMLASGKHLKTILDSSMTEYRRLIVDEQLDCEWKEQGLLYVLQTEKGMHEFSQTDQILSDHFGVKAQCINGADLPAFDPALKQDLAGAFHYPEDASVRPDLLNSQWVARLKQNGVKFIENCELQGLSKSAGRITQLKTSCGVMDAHRFVFATGAWSPQISAELDCRIPIQPGKGYSITMQRPTPCPQYPMLFPEHKVGVSPFQNGYRLGSMMEFSGYDTSIPEHRIAQLRKSAEPYLIAPSTENAQETWFGWRPMTWDSLPIIGRTPRLMNAYLATGHNMLGMSLATATGKLIAELIQGKPTHIDANPFSPTRF
ncbi:FAD-dependent oxidoreductase [uncultured Gimesia sp.]|uniref:NAD(P)/FAD-dependent oxidoreductase n=1 Tax=uncultured Gimesia sp. TaxID=1678688 RepID=UPI0030DBC3C0|tara:strand:- start:81308 stop:82567 length:1260 start_codon:yes stop_codon:yes gene_type:complete